MTTTVPATNMILMQRDRRSRRPPSPDEPLYAALAAKWHQAGRVVPGNRDREWADALVREV